MREPYVDCYVCEERYPLEEKRRWMVDKEIGEEVYSVCSGRCCDVLERVLKKESHQLALGLVRSGSLRS